MIRVDGASADGVMMFGFGIAFVTIVFLLYRDELKFRLPVLAMLFGASAGYGFMQGAWPLGLLLVMLAVIELRRWWSPSVASAAEASTVILPEIPTYAFESRMSRMFGR